MTSKEKTNEYYKIYDFMIQQLNLKGVELLVYALLYSFTTTGEGKFTGSIKYLAERTNCTKRSIITCMSSLLKRNLIQRSEEKQSKGTYAYQTTFIKASIGGEKTSLNM